MSQLDTCVELTVCRVDRNPSESGPVRCTDANYRLSIVANARSELLADTSPPTAPVSGRSHAVDSCPVPFAVTDSTSSINQDVPSSTHMFVKELFAAVIFRFDVHQKSQPLVIVNRDLPPIMLL